MLVKTEQMEGVTKSIHDRISSWERGRIFFLDDFAWLQSPEAVRFALHGMVKERFVVRIARGVYCYPKIEGKYSMRVVLPSEEMIAQCFAQKEKVRIIPYGDQAAYRLGLTTMRISDLKYLTDGAPRKISLASTRKIDFNHTDEVKMFGYKNETMQNIASAVRFLTAEMIDAEKKRIIRKHLRTVPEKEYWHDITIPPAWVGKIITDIWNT